MTESIPNNAYHSDDMAPARPSRRSWWAPTLSNTSSGALQTTAVWKSTTAGRLEGCSSERSGATLHLECPSGGPGPVPWAGWSWAGWRWERNSGCTSPRTPWAAAAAATHGAPAAAETTREKAGKRSGPLWPLTPGQCVFRLQRAENFYSDHRLEVCAIKIVDLFCIT